MSRIYVASSWRNGHQQNVVKALREAGHHVYDFRNPPEGDWTEDEPWFDKAGNAPLRSDMAFTAFAVDRHYMSWARVFVVVLPCGRSAHMEAGWATATGRPVVFYNPDRVEEELMYRLAGRPNEVIVYTMDDLIKWLK